MRTNFAALALLSALSGCARTSVTGSGLTPADLARLDWDAITQRARGSTVNFGMWAGDDVRNRYFQTTVTRTLRQQFGITLRIVPCADTVELVNKLLNERSAGRHSGGSIDMIWINGENFRTARQAQVLWGPFANALPNLRFYDPEATKRDFGTPVEGYEAPWQKSQFVFAYDQGRTPEPPRSIDSLRDWIKAHPGRFTYIAPPDYTGSAFIRHVLIHFGGGWRQFQSGFREDLYARAAELSLEYLGGIRPYLWRHGETYPATLKELNRLFANQEVDFAMSYGPDFAALAIERGEFPATTRTFVLSEGTIGNYNFLAVPFNAANVAGALVTINQLMSFDQLMDMCRALGNSFPLELGSLTEAQRRSVRSLPAHAASLSIEELQSHFMPEPDAEYLTRFEKDWRARVLRR
ncbi:MAG TPA: ABC transporter substrate-binding protein [Bryobacteraceae bacterium]|nr:ABC transporter substrate-binding protein [Bryobacteraceae bacterium]